MHYVGTLGAFKPNPTFAGHSTGFTEAVLVDHTSGSVHTGLSVAQLDPGGSIAPHMHAYEVGFYLLSGHVIASIGDQTYRFKTGDFGCIRSARSTPGATRTPSRLAGCAWPLRSRSRRDRSATRFSRKADSRRPPTRRGSIRQIQKATCSATSIRDRFRRATKAAWSRAD